MITIKELMTSDPFTLSGDNTLQDARKLMTEHHIRHIPIIDSKKMLVGLVTQRDILEATDPESQDNRGAQLSGIMIENVSSIHQNDSVRQAAIHLQAHKYGCLPVVEDNILIGIITDSDFIDIAINLLEQLEMTEEEDNFDSDMMDDIELPELDEDI